MALEAQSEKWTEEVYGTECSDAGVLSRHSWFSLAEVVKGGSGGYRM